MLSLQAPSLRAPMSSRRKPGSLRHCEEPKATKQSRVEILRSAQDDVFVIARSRRRRSNLALRSFAPLRMTFLSLRGATGDEATPRDDVNYLSEIERLKGQPRGPYPYERWFCPEKGSENQLW